ncbi:MAG: class I SAM-dependent methyltransferase, partial [Solirubrobacteraceae bacterium]
RVLATQQRRMLERFLQLLKPNPNTRVLDLGVNGSLARREQYFFEAGYPWPERVVACGLEAPDAFAACFPRTPYVRGTRELPLPFETGSFDLVFCNAVIEHVGSRARQAAFLAEILRVGRAAFVTTPNRWYPIELHTVLPLAHWLPTRIHRALLRGLGFGFFAREENLNLLDQRALRSLVPPERDAQIHAQRFLGLVSNFLLVVTAEKDGP